MSVYYNYYLERRVGDEWQVLSPRNLKEDNLLYWHTGSFGTDFADHYTLSQLTFSEYNQEAQKAYKDAYKKIQNGESRWENWYPEYYQMDLKRLIQDYQNQIHERSGIISKNDRLLLEDDSEYEPDIVSPQDFHLLPQRIQENYDYYAWDTPWSEYGHLYDIIPKVLEMMEQYPVQVDELRLTYSIT